MLNPDVETALVPQFQGSMNGQDAYNIDPAHGLYSLNIDFFLNPSSLTPAVQCATRRGTSQVAQVSLTDEAITTVFSWYFSGTDQVTDLVTYSPINGVRIYPLAALTTPSAIVIPVTGAAYAVFVSDGTRLYAAFNSGMPGPGVSQGYVLGLVGEFVTVPAIVDTLFSSPLPTTIATVSISQPGAGVITAGTGNIGYVFITRNGDAAELLNPVTAAGVFAPVSYTAADGVHNLAVAIDFLSIPSYLNQAGAPTTPIVQIVMTSKSNPNEYYLVPGAIGNVPASPGTVTITFSITDGDLVTGTNVTENQNLLSAVNGSGPFFPSSIFTYSSRMAYVTYDAASFPVIYFSDQNNYQSLTAAFHGIYLDGRQIPIHGCSLGGLCYIATVAALYATQDNGGQPGTWTPPARIDGSVGALSPTCMVAVSGKILIASEKGLYVYRGGAFPQIPLSYWQGPDWNRINWLAPSQVQVVDDSLDKVIRVLAPLQVFITGASNTNPIQITTAILIDNAPLAYPHLFQTGLGVTISGVGGNTAANGTFAITVTGANTFTIPAAGNGAYIPGTQGWSGIAVPGTPNAQMCWAYPAGDAPGETFYSIHAFTAYRASSMCTVRNRITNTDETWFGPSASNPGGIIRRVIQTDPLIYRDMDLSGNPAAINSLNETSLLPGSQDESVTIHDYDGMHARISGSGALNITAYSLDHTLAVIPLASPITLSRTPGLEVLIKWFLRNEQQSIAFGTNGIDQYFVAALLRVYYSNTLPMR